MKIVKKSYKSSIDIEDVKKFVFNVNVDLNKYNDIFTNRNRNINFKDTLYYLAKYNLDVNSSYDSTNIKLFNNDENNDITSQSYINKRNKILIEHLININTNLIDSLYKHLQFKNNNRYIAVDGSQLNFLSSLNKHFKASSNGNYSYTYLSCLFDVDNKIPINYLVSNEDERSMLTKQLQYLNSNDTLIGDRGYYSENLINSIQQHNLKFIFRISKHICFYIDNIKIINLNKEGSIEVLNGNLKYKLHWYSTRIKQKDFDKELKNIENKIILIKNEEHNLKNELKTINNEYRVLFDRNKFINLELKKKISNVKKKKLNIELTENRKIKNTLKNKSDDIQIKISKLKKEYSDFFQSKKKLELDKNSDYIILTNDLTKSTDEIKELYKKRWEVETHFKFIKEYSKINRMNNKNINYVNQNIQITHLLFIIESYINNLLIKSSKDKNKKVKKSNILASLQDKLLFFIINEDKSDIKKILEKMTKLLKNVIKVIKTDEHKPRQKKRPQTNYYNSNYG